MFPGEPNRLRHAVERGTQICQGYVRWPRLGRIGGIAAAVAPLFRREPDSSPRRHWKENETREGNDASRPYCRAVRTACRPADRAGERHSHVARARHAEEGERLPRRARRPQGALLAEPVELRLALLA